MGQLKTSAKKALFFAESFGLVPETVVARSVATGAPVEIALVDSLTPTTSIGRKSADTPKVMQTLYLLERFGVSDEFYHELTQVCVCVCVLWVLVITLYCLIHTE